MAQTAQTIRVVGETGCEADDDVGMCQNRTRTHRDDTWTFGWWRIRGTVEYIFGTGGTISGDEERINNGHCAREKEKERKEQARAKRRVESKKAKRRQAKEASCRKKDWAKAINVSFLKGHCAFFYYFRRLQLLLNKPDASCEGSLGQAGQSHATEALEENKEVRQQKRLEKSRDLNDLSTGFP